MRQLSALVLATLVCLLACQAEPAQRPGTFRGSPVLPTRMFGSKAGWARVLTGQLLHTADGGRTWSNVTPRAERGWDIGTADEYFLDAGHAWVAEQDGPRMLVFGSADGGRHWQTVVAAPADGPYLSASVSFPTALEGWLLVTSNRVAAASWVYRTHDGGLHWTQVATGQALGTTCPSAISAISATAAWVAVFDCSQPVPAFGLSVSSDGGATWQPQALPPVALTCPCYGTPPRFLDGQHGFLVVRGSGGLQLLASADGGVSWSLRITPPADQVEFVDAASGWAATLAGAEIWRSTDGGRSWTAVSTDLAAETTEGHINGYAFVDSSLAFASRFNTRKRQISEVLKTTDGGRTWRAIG